MSEDIEQLESQESTEGSQLDQQKETPIQIPSYAEESNTFQSHQEEYRRQDAQEIWQDFDAQYQDIRTEFFLAGVPEELIYLAFTESRCDLDAQSRADAVGPFQLRESTAERWGLKVVPGIIDERKDPTKAAKVAAQVLSEIYDLTYTWNPPMPNEDYRWGWVLLSYNRGSIFPLYKKHGGDIQAYLSASGTGQEQREYVYKFYAAKSAFHEVQTEPRDIFPCPLIYQEQGKPTTHSVQEGESISAISIQHDRTITRIIAYNLQENPEFSTKLQPGDKILIPNAARATVLVKDLDVDTSEFQRLNPHLGSSVMESRRGIPETTIYFPDQASADAFYRESTGKIESRPTAEQESSDRDLCLTHAGRMFR